MDRGLMRTAMLLCGAYAIVACAGKGGLTSSYVPCGVLTKEEVASVIGESVSNVQEVPPDRCRYFGANPADFITVKASQTGANTLFEGADLAWKMMQVKQAPSAGIGDESYWDGYIIWARKGDAFVSIDMRFSPVNVTPAGTKLASLALSRL
jgi:hypothetical protein